MKRNNENNGEIESEIISVAKKYRNVEVMKKINEMKAKEENEREMKENDNRK